MKKIKLISVVIMVLLSVLLMVACESQEPEIKIERDIQGTGLGEYKSDVEKPATTIATQKQSNTKIKIYDVGEDGEIIIPNEFDDNEKSPSGDIICNDDDIDDYYKYLNDEQIKEVKEFVDNFYFENIDGKFEGSDLKFKKEITILKWLNDNVKYDYDALENHSRGDTSDKMSYTSYAALIDKKAVCDGISSAFALLCKRCDIAVKKLYVPNLHAWNMVQLDDDAWYHVDPTYNICSDTLVRNTNFNDKDVEDYHWHYSWWKPNSAKAHGTKYNYYYVEDYLKNELSVSDSFDKESIDDRIKFYNDRKVTINGITGETYNTYKEGSACHYYMDNDAILHITSELPSTDHIIYGSSDGGGFGIDENIEKEIKKVTIHDTINAKTLNMLFGHFEHITDIEGLDKINTLNVENMDGVFYECKLLKNIDLSKFNTSKVKTMEYMFIGCKNIETLDISTFDFSSVENASRMLEQCEKLKIINANNTFIKLIDEKGIDYVGLNSKEWLISGNKLERKEAEAKSYTTKPGEKNQTAGNTVYWYIENNELHFAGNKPSNSNYQSGQEINKKIMGGAQGVPWRTHNDEINKIVIDNTIKPKDMSNYFSELEQLVEITGIENIDTSECTSFNFLFSGDKKLKRIDVSKFVTKNVKFMGHMFNNCESLENIDISNFDFSKCISITSMFNGCKSLKSIGISDFNIPSDCNYEHVFNLCTKLEGINIDKYGGY